MTVWSIIGAIAIPHVGAWAGVAIGCVKNNVGNSWYEYLKKPRWNPNNILLGSVWTVWYTCMGYASYLVYRDCGGFTSKAALPLSVYGAHLLVNWSWIPVFFRSQSLVTGLVHIVTLDAAVVATAACFFPINRNSLYFMLPYMCWMVFDTTLMHRIWKDNKDDEKLRDFKDTK